MEVMVSIGLLGAVSLLGVKLMSNNLNSTKTTQTLSEFNVVYSKIHQNLLSAKACENTLGGGDIRTVTLEDIKSKLGHPVFDKINKFGSGTLKITDIQLKGIQNLGLFTFRSIEDSFEINPIPAGAVGYGEINLEVSFEKIGKGVLGGKHIKRLFILRVEADENYAITKCFSSLNDSVEATKNQICIDLGGIPDSSDGCILTGGPSIGHKVKNSACEMLGGVHNGTTGRCDTASFIVSCGPKEYLQSFNLLARTKVCKPASGEACKPTTATSFPDGKDNDCDGDIDENTCPSGYTAISASMCERVVKKPSIKGCQSGYRVGSQLGSSYPWDKTACYKSKGSYTCQDTANYKPDADSFGFCELRRIVDKTRPCPSSYPVGHYSVNYCYIAPMAMKGVAICAGGASEAISSGTSGSGTCYETTGLPATDKCSSGYTYTAASGLCERTSQKPLMYY